MKYKHMELWLSCCCFCYCYFDVLVPTSAHSLLFLDKWFVRIYLNVKLARLLKSMMTCEQMVLCMSENGWKDKRRAPLHFALRLQTMC